MFFTFLTQEIIVKFTVDSSRTGELHVQGTCYVYVLWLRSVLLKLPTYLRAVLAWLSNTYRTPWNVVPFINSSTERVMSEWRDFLQSSTCPVPFLWNFLGCFVSLVAPFSVLFISRALHPKRSSCLAEFCGSDSGVHSDVAFSHQRNRNRISWTPHLFISCVKCALTCQSIWYGALGWIWPISLDCGIDHYWN